MTEVGCWHVSMTVLRHVRWLASSNEMTKQGTADAGWGDPGHHLPRRHNENERLKAVIQTSSAVVSRPAPAG
jgi:hypothetical protein